MNYQEYVQIAQQLQMQQIHVVYIYILVQNVMLMQVLTITILQ
jgi:hypothetical protein